MERIVVVADTHMPRKNRDLARPLLDAMERADAIFHLGDFTSIEVMDLFRRYAPVHAVHGNNDNADLVALLPGIARVQIGGKSFVLLHGHIGGTTAIRAARTVSDGDAVVFGHSHRAYCQTEGGRLLFNPGSPSDRRWSQHRSFGVIEVDAVLRPSIVTLP